MLAAAVALCAAAGGDAVVTPGTAFFTGVGNRLWAVDSGTGSVKWVVSEPRAFSPPTLARGLLWYGTNASTLHAVHAANGTAAATVQLSTARCWRGGAVDPCYVTRALHDPASDSLLVAGWCCRVFALSASPPHRVLWDASTADRNTSETPCYVNAEPVLVPGVGAAVASWNGRVYAVSRGNVLWNYTAARSIDGAPLVSGGRLWVGSNDGTVACLRAETGSVAWTYQAANSVVGGVATDGQRVFFGSVDGDVYALQAKDGEAVWRFRTGGMVFSRPAAVGGVVYVGSLDGFMYALNASTGGPVWKYRTRGRVDASPTVADGAVWWWGDDCFLYAANSSTGQQLWAVNTTAHLPPGEHLAPFQCV
eukprot:TRINITY_DN17412_c0_g1_i1.p2 TRINITY_DN17412_c0_g1~~TRINITY_DN17412_c0_g1_i1.p2  ORF type:complete len:365 (+),score=114.17 TRINITY_DN17412_c0_g1_i1:50-1144(+)